MFHLYTAANLVEATLLQGLLAGAGIETQVFNQYSLGASGEIPLDQTRPQLWLTDAEQRQQAEALISDYERQAHNDQERIFCRQCHEPNPRTFELCWNCGHELD